jgi:hypothetical protein
MNAEMKLNFITKNWRNAFVLKASYWGSGEKSSINIRAFNAAC